LDEDLNVAIKYFCTVRTDCVGMGNVAFRQSYPAVKTAGFS